MEATRQAICGWMLDVFGEERAGQVMRNVKFTIHKPPAMITIDDRVWLFRGVWPTVDQIQAFKPWRSYDDDEPEKPSADMNRALMVLVSGMVAASAAVSLRSDKADEARIAIKEIHDIFAQSDEAFLAGVFERIMKFE